MIHFFVEPINGFLEVPINKDSLKKRATQLEGPLSSTVRAVDKVTADVEVLMDYAVENNKVINSILHKLDDHAEQF